MNIKAALEQFKLATQKLEAAEAALSADSSLQADIVEARKAIAGAVDAAHKIAHNTGLKSALDDAHDALLDLSKAIADLL